MVLALCIRGLRKGIEMSETYFYSANTNAFYPLSLKNEYVNTNSWPDDLVQISSIYYQRIMDSQTKGFRILPNEQGQPTIKNPPLPTEEEKIAAAEAKKVELMQKSNEEMTPLLYAVELKMETEEEAALLIEWKKYQVLLSRIDTSKPDLINWPSAPLQGLC